MDDLDLLTVKQVADALFMDESGIRRLLRASKLDGMKEEGRVLVKPESVRRYIAAQPHPPQYMAALRKAQQVVGRLPRMRMYSPYLRAGLTPPVNSLEAVVERMAIHHKEIKDALKVKDYGRADAAMKEIWREATDYEMLYEALN